MSPRPGPPPIPQLGVADVLALASYEDHCERAAARLQLAAAASLAVPDPAAPRVVRLPLACRDALALALEYAAGWAAEDWQDAHDCVDWYALALDALALRARPEARRQGGGWVVRVPAGEAACVAARLLGVLGAMRAAAGEGA